MFCKLVVQFAIVFVLLLSISFCEDRQKKSKDSSIEASQTATQTTGSRPLSASAPYQAPRSVSYPFGDESMVNNDMLNKSATTEANCADENEFMEYKPECTGPVEGTDELYVTCMKSDLTIEPTDSIYSSSTTASTTPVNIPSLFCKRCDLQKNSENTAVIINCVHCFDYGNPSVSFFSFFRLAYNLSLIFFQEQNRTCMNFTCTANYLEIKNYTKPFYRTFKEF